MLVAFTDSLSKNLAVPPDICCYSSEAESKIVWQITDRCHLHCGYCFTPSRKARDLTLTEALHLVVRLRQTFPAKQRLLIAGREPLLFQGIEDVITKASALGFCCSMSTTGELLTDAWLETLRESGLTKFNFTLNSPFSEHHELSRPGSRHSRVVQAIRLSLSAGFVVRVNVNVVSSDTQIAVATTRFLINLGVRKVSLGVLHPSGPKPLNLADYDRLTSQLAEQVQDLRNRADVKVIAPPKEPCHKSVDCPVRRGLISVLPDGRIVGCNIFPGYFDSPLGGLP
jgi:MoaA/NifB/PqqE/SkfB family radical SAM enzyme